MKRLLYVIEICLSHLNVTALMKNNFDNARIAKIFKSLKFRNAFPYQLFLKTLRFSLTHYHSEQPKQA